MSAFRLKSISRFLLFLVCGYFMWKHISYRIFETVGKKISALRKQSSINLYQQRFLSQRRKSRQSAPLNKKLPRPPPPFFFFKKGGGGGGVFFNPKNIV